MNTVLFIIILIAVLWNVVSYAGAYFIWRRDCREIGKDHLAVSLKERFSAVFLYVTLPCLVGFVIAITKK